ncbi:hypothetical protein FAIPA1_60037 [Frankia sp. AiPs1]
MITPRATTSGSAPSRGQAGDRGQAATGAGYDCGWTQTGVANAWARQGSNLRPLGCKPRALPLSYAPGSRQSDHASQAYGKAHPAGIRYPPAGRNVAPVPKARPAGVRGVRGVAPPGPASSPAAEDRRSTSTRKKGSRRRPVLACRRHTGQEGPCYTRRLPHPQSRGRRGP